MPHVVVSKVDNPPFGINYVKSSVCGIHLYSGALGMAFCFLEDNWWGLGSLDQRFNTHSILNLKFFDFLCNGYWNYNIFLENLPKPITDSIMEVPYDMKMPDIMMFNNFIDGDFSHKEVWNNIKSRATPKNVLKKFGILIFLPPTQFSH